MCGIIGCVGEDDALEVLLDGLDTLEYRGYDSAGVALTNGLRSADGVAADGAATGGLEVVKRAGELAVLRETIATLATPPTGTTGIGHTRWSTHGPPTDANAHPHTDAEGRVAVVHNGIIENHQALRDDLEDEGVAFTSDTDTEVVPHLIASALAEGAGPEEAVRRAVSHLEGSYALVAVFAGQDALFATRNGSPLVVGVGDDRLFVGSDVPAFLEHTRDVVYLDDGEFVTLRPNAWTVTDGAGGPVSKAVRTVEWEPEQTAKSGYDHFMLKEIHEQPAAIRQGLSGRLDELTGSVTLEELDAVPTPARVQFVACGTSYHASLFGVELLRRAGIPAQAFLASEYATGPAPVPEDGLVVGVTQSGETADTLVALREAAARGARTLALTNVVGSTAARECDHAVFIRSGPEIGVAATKTFSSQLTVLNLLAAALADGGSGASGDGRPLVRSLRDLPGKLQQLLDETDVEPIVEAYADHDAFFFIGRGLDYPVALEGALKFKEITYEHAEGFAAGELKHGPLALVTERTPVFAVVTGDGDVARKTVGNVKEVEARNAPVVAITDGRSDVERYADDVLSVPETHARTASILANVQLQLVAYHVANRLGREIDKPRNLAKSVTVE